jgi:hypothetical protein
MKKTLFGIAAGFTLLAAPSALADEFTEDCTARTAEYFPDIADPATSCSCIMEKASEELLTEMKAAETPEELPEEALEVMAECGYDFPEE